MSTSDADASPHPTLTPGASFSHALGWAGRLGAAEGQPQLRTKNREPRQPTARRAPVTAGAC